MRRERGAAASVVLLALLPLAGGAQVDSVSGWSDADRTLSPYFEVQGGAPGVDVLPLSETDVDVHIAGVMASVVVRQVYENRGSRPIHAKYVFPASTRAAVSGLRMRIGARVVEAVIREKEEARREYEAAKREGKNAALLEQVRPNVFDMRLANVMPGDRIEVELRYTELLVPEEGVYEFVYPTVVGPRYTGSPDPRVALGPLVPTGVALPGRGGSGADTVGAVSPDAVPLGEGRWDDWTTTAYLREPSGSPWSFDLDVEITSGIPLRGIAVPTHEVETVRGGGTSARVSLADSERHGANRDYILRYTLAGDEVASGLMVHRGAEESYFLLMVEPPERVLPEDLPPREYIFVVDVSGSMRGFPLNTSKELLAGLVGGLRESDTFNVLLFASGSRLFAPRSLPATPENVAHALHFIDEQRGGGGTELPAALERALALPRPTPRARAVVVATDGFISGEAGAFEIARTRRGDAGVFVFGIGSSVNRHLVEGLARAGMSESFVVTEPSEAASAARRFREYVSAPVLTEVAVDFGEADVYDVAPRSLPDVMASRPVVVYGKLRGEPRGRVTLRGTGGAGAYERAFALEEAPTDGSDALRYLWARKRVAELSDPAYAGGEANRDEIVRLGLEHALLTRYTSFIAVDRIVRNPDGRGTDVEQAQPLPEGMEALETGRPLQRAPEPELWILALMALAAVAARRWSGARGRGSRA